MDYLALRQSYNDENNGNKYNSVNFFLDGEVSNLVYVHIVEYVDFGLPKDKILGFFIQIVLVGRLMRKGQRVRLCAMEVGFYPFPIGT